MDARSSRLAIARPSVVMSWPSSGRPLCARCIFASASNMIGCLASVSYALLLSSPSKSSIAAEAFRYSRMACTRSHGCRSASSGVQPKAAQTSETTASNGCGPFRTMPGSAVVSYPMRYSAYCSHLFPAWQASPPGRRQPGNRALRHGAMRTQPGCREAEGAPALSHPSSSMSGCAVRTCGKYRPSCRR